MEVLGASFFTESLFAVDEDTGSNIRTYKELFESFRVSRSSKDPLNRMH